MLTFVDLFLCWFPGIRLFMSLLFRLAATTHGVESGPAGRMAALTVFPPVIKGYKKCFPYIGSEGCGRTLN